MRTNGTPCLLRQAPRIGSGALVLVGLLCSGCYTTTNVVAVTPLETKYPVSASGQYVDASGNIVDGKQYGVVRPFEFERTMKAPRHEHTEARLALEPELDRLVAQNRGDAVTDLKIEGIGYETGSHYSSAMWKQWGWGFGLTGATFVVLGAANDNMRSSFIPVGAVLAGIGALGFVLGAVTDDPAEWKFKVSGHVVKRNGVAAPVAPTANPAAPTGPTGTFAVPTAPVAIAPSTAATAP